MVIILTTPHTALPIQHFFLPSLSNKKPAAIVLVIDPIEERLPSNDISVSVIGLCNGVRSDEKSKIVNAGHMNVTPIFKTTQHTKTKKIPVETTIIQE